MCRITGLVDFSNNLSYNQDEVIKQMRDTMSYGGPDDAGSFSCGNSNYHIAFGHRRLSIIDISNGGHQPMLSDDESIIVVFNGEIFNYNEIRNDLINAGYSFKTHSDTEVIVQAYRAWGIKSIDKFIGMFAFLLFDRKEEVIYAVRDRVGVKPLYYYKSGNILLFGSELKSFHPHPFFKKEINKDALNGYFQFGYIMAPQTIFADAYKLRPGHYCKVDLKRKTTEDIVYWDALAAYKQPLMKGASYQEIFEETEQILKSACEYRMVSDVPVGVFLSGGYDSSLVTSLLQHDRTDKLKTFSIGFTDKKYDEALHAKKVAEYLGTDHTEYYCTDKDAQDIIPLLPEIYDEPFGDSSAIPTTLVSKIARRSVKVALSADGGDEIFGGYMKHAAILKIKKGINIVPPFIYKNAGKFIQFLKPDAISGGSLKNSFFKRSANFSRILTSQNMGEMMYWLTRGYTESQLKGIVNAPPAQMPEGFKAYSQFGKESDDINSMLAIDLVTYLPDDILTKVDRATMSVSLEGREPLLDHRIIELMARIPGEMKINNGVKKYILKEIVHKHIPKELIDRPKMGFGINLKEWFRNELKEIAEYYLSEHALQKTGLFNEKKVRELVHAFYKGNDLAFTFVWYLLMFQMWYHRWMETSSGEVVQTSLLMSV